MMRAHGGKRRGAGRKPLGRIRKVVTLAPESVEILTLRTRRKKTTGQVIDRALALLKVTPPTEVDRALAVLEIS